MNLRQSVLATCAGTLLLAASVFPTSASAQGPAFSSSEHLDRLTKKVVAAAVERFGKGGLTADRLAVTLIDLNDRQRPAWASHRGNERTYPASVVKLFYMVAAHREMEEGRLKPSAELDRALHDMIVTSSNDATHYIVDRVTGTTAGPELDDAELREWMDKRNSVNRYFASLGYNNINVNQKTWCEGPYGRELQGLGPNRELRNKLTSDAVARLVYEIITGRAVAQSRSRAMMNLMHRDPFVTSEDTDNQSTAFIGKSLPKGSQYYSKAGWTSDTRHDAAYVRLPNGAEYILVVFTVDNSNQADIIPFVSKLVADEFSQSKTAADLILVNGRIWTGVASKPWAEAVASRGERLIAVGSNDEIRKLASGNTRVIDLAGKLALPGFIDDHTHFIDGGFHLLSVQLRDASTPQEFARRIREHAAKLPRGRWIGGGDWDHESWPGAPLPTKELIDRDTADNPVFVTRLDGHMGLANSAALRLAGITKETKDPAGGTIVRDPVTGEPTGVLKDDAMGIVNALIPNPSPAEYQEALAASLKEAARVGVTSVQDITPWNHYEAYKSAHDSGRLTVRVYARTPMSQWKRQAELVSRQGPGDQWLRLGGLKAFMDGSLGSTTAFFFEPFADAPNTSGLMVEDNIPEGKLKQQIKDADKAGLQCSIHAIGDKANDLLLDYFEEAAKDNGPRDRRFRIEHAQHLTPSDITRFSKLGVIASMQPYHAVDDGRWAEKRIGPVRIKSTYAFRSLLDSGATLVFGSDWYVAPLSPLLGIHAAVTRATIDGKNPRGWVPEQKITVEEAVKAYTSSAAYAEFAEREKGSLEQGKLADIVVLSQDIFRINPDDIKKVEVVYTIVGGRVVGRGQ
ncbi:MAG TPA: amidohydrolase family protein [Blastocatellia bacterium]|nr:amidohydrolase family protein [Blastocatellia bacterium]